MANKVEVIITEKGTAKTYSKRVKGADRATTSLVKSALKLSVAYFGARGVISAFQKTITAAGDAQEVVSKFEAVFKEQADAARVFAQDLAIAVGRSETELLSFLSTLQDTFVPMGFARDQAAALSKQLVTLAIDVASFNDKADADVIRDFQSALVGNTETVRKYGIVITEARLKQEALDSGLIDTARTLTEQEKIQLRLRLITQGTTDAQGDAIRTLGSFNNQTKAAGAAAQTLAETLGDILLPTVTTLVGEFTAMTQSITAMITMTENLDVKTVKYHENLLVGLKLNKRTREDLGLSAEAIDRQIEGAKAVIEILKQQQAAQLSVTDLTKRQIETVMAGLIPTMIETQGLLENELEIKHALKLANEALLQTDLQRAQESAAATQQFTTAALGLSNQLATRKIQDINQTRDAEIQAVLDSTKSEEGKAAAIKVIQEKAALATSKARKAQKPFLIAEAVANTALAVIKALDDAPFPFNIGIAALIGAAGAVEIATINAQKFARGTAFAPGGLAVVGEGGPELVNLPRGSRVFNNTDSRNIVNNQGPERITIEIDGQVLGEVLVRQAELDKNRLAFRA